MLIVFKMVSSLGWNSFKEMHKINIPCKQRMFGVVVYNNTYDWANWNPFEMFLVTLENNCNYFMTFKIIFQSLKDLIYFL